MEGSIRLRFPRTSRIIWKVFLLATIITVVSGLFWGNFATADHAPRTFYREPAEGKPGTVVKVLGEHCDLDGRRLQASRVSFAWLPSGAATPYATNREYTIKPDYSWSGEFPIPTTASGEGEFSQHCYASDMVFPGHRLPFSILAGAPPALTRNPSEGKAGRVVSLTGSNCTTPPELGFPQGRALKTAKAHFAPKGKETPIASSSEFPVASDGTWKGSITVPSTASPGSYDLWARCWNDSLTLETARVSFRVLGEPNSSPSPSPPSSYKPEGGVRSTPSSSVEGSPTAGEGETPTATAADTWKLAQLEDENSSGGVAYWAAVALAVVLLAGGATAAVLVRKRLRAPQVGRHK